MFFRNELFLVLLSNAYIVSGWFFYHKGEYRICHGNNFISGINLSN